MERDAGRKMNHDFDDEMPTIIPELGGPIMLLWQAHERSILLEKPLSQELLIEACIPSLDTIQKYVSFSLPFMNFD